MSFFDVITTIVGLSLASYLMHLGGLVPDTSLHVGLCVGVITCYLGFKLGFIKSPEKIEKRG